MNIYEYQYGDRPLVVTAETEDEAREKLAALIEQLGPEQSVNAAKSMRSGSAAKSMRSGSAQLKTRPTDG